VHEGLGGDVELVGGLWLGQIVWFLWLGFVMLNKGDEQENRAE
jgi:hypothetical protein